MLRFTVYACVSYCLSSSYCFFSFFFFSSRRRHTRFDCDWSSDVCSSDLFWTQFSGAANDNLFKFALTVMVTYQLSVSWLPSAMAGLGIGALFILPFLLFSATSGQDRKSTPLKSRHSQKSYAGFCLKKKKKNIN